jgi:hypothetical protein
VSWPAKAAGSSSGFAAAALLPPSASFMSVSLPAGDAAAALPLAAVAAAPALPPAVAAAAVPSSSFCFLLSPTRRSSISLAAPAVAGREEGKKTGETGEGRTLSSSSTADLASGLADKLQQLRPPAGVLLRAAAARRPLLACQAGALELGLQRGRAELQGIKHQREGDLRQGAVATAGRHTAIPGGMAGQEGRGWGASRSVGRLPPPAQRPLCVSVSVAASPAAPCAGSWPSAAHLPCSRSASSAGVSSSSRGVRVRRKQRALGSKAGWCNECPTFR